MSVNPNAVVWVGLCAVLGALLGSVLVGLAVGLGLIVLVTAITAATR